MKGFTFVKTCLLGVFLFTSQFSIAQQEEESLEAMVELVQVDINHADAITIALVLTGIGFSRAEAIVAYREEHGLFQSFEDLIMVKGVGEATVFNNEDRIVFD